MESGLFYGPWQVVGCGGTIGIGFDAITSRS